jgi:hypothetical protein
VIVVKIELWSAVTGARDEIGRMYIANVGGTHQRGEYKGAVCRRGSTDVPHPIGASHEATRVGEVLNYPRLSYNVWRLILRMLRSCFPEEKP